MKLLCIISVGILCSLYPSTSAFGVNGGINCATCSIFVALVEQLMEVKNVPVVTSLDQICQYLPAHFHSDCRKAIGFLEPILVKLIVQKNGPDVTCHALRFCYTHPGQPTCKLITPSFESLEVSFEERVARARHVVHDALLEIPHEMFICEIPGIRNICKWFEWSLANREPLDDLDKDGFSPTQSFRGSAWRGKDCSDMFAYMHPGAIPVDGDKYFDSNCNGIFGVNNVTKQTYEDELCSKSEPRGVMALGDSISAHFSLPPNWLDATKISKDAFKHLNMILSDEIDWPMLSSITGHGNNTWTEVIRGPMDSIYNRMVKRNRCNHRDYQNIAENGEQSFNVHKLMKTMSRRPAKDRPLLVLFALFGNDICKGHDVTLDNMTTPEEMYGNTMTSLKYMNQRLPRGSHVAVVGLGDGRVLYKFMHDRIHPIGTFWQGLTYSQYYDYMNCLRISPCPAWLNTDHVLRDRAAKRMEELNKVLQDLVKKHKGAFSNFKLYYLENPTERVIKKWADKGGLGWQLVEPSDGFHSNQIAQALTSEVYWEMLQAHAPEALGPINPHNAIIQTLFGNQGGL